MSKKSNPKKVKKKTKKSFIADELATAAPTEESSSAPKLDRFGLPIVTEDDIFPPLSEDLVRVPVTDGEYDPSTTMEAIRQHLGVDLNHFDKDGYSTQQHSSETTESNWKLNLLHADPPVFTIDNFFSPQECDEYMNMVDVTSSQYDESNTVPLISPTFANAISRRTSTTYFCRYSSVPTLLSKARYLLNKIDLHQFEEPQIVRYSTGQEFSYHYDEIPKVQLENGGQRLATLLVYLNDVKKGGATVFRDLNDSSNRQLKVQPKRGMALLFFPAYEDGRADPRTLHKGEVAGEEKMIAQVWIHERDYKANAPLNNLQSEALEGVEAEDRRLGFC